MKKHETRESWLMAATELLNKEFFSGRGYSLPNKIQVACGIPFGSAKAVGQYWPPSNTEDETINIFICPSLGEPIRVLATHLHELVHAATPGEKHGGAFKKLAREFGLAGKLTATYAEEGSELWNKLAALSTSLGDYPHSPMKKKAPKEKQKANGGWVRLYSPQEEKYKTLISPKMLEEFGVPLDPWGNEMVPVEAE